MTYEEDNFTWFRFQSYEATLMETKTKLNFPLKFLDIISILWP